MKWRIRAALAELRRTTGRAQEADVELYAAMAVIEELAARVTDDALRQTVVSRATLTLQAGQVARQG
jgi:hypothetical protein